MQSKWKRQQTKALVKAEVVMPASNNGNPSGRLPSQGKATREVKKEAEANGKPPEEPSRKRNCLPGPQNNALMVRNAEKA